MGKLILALLVLLCVGCKGETSKCDGKIEPFIEGIEKLPEYDSRMSILGFRIYACSKSLNPGWWVEELHRIPDNSAVLMCDVFDCSKGIITYQNGKPISMAGPGMQGTGGNCSLAIPDVFLGVPNSPKCCRIPAGSFYEYVVTAIPRPDAPRGKYRWALKSIGEWHGCDESTPSFSGFPVYGPVIDI